MLSLSTSVGGIDRFDETDFGNDDKAANLAVSDHRPVWAVFSITQDDDGSDENGQITAPVQISEDVNGDGVINIQDLVLVASNFGQTGRNTADVNGDGVVNIVDITLVAGALGGGDAPTVGDQTGHQ